MIANHFIVLTFALATVGLTSRAHDSEPEQVIQLGTVKVDDYTGQVLFQDPGGDGKSYRITLAIPKPWEAPGIASDRIEVWLLASSGKALAINSRPRGEVLLEAGSAGATANAIFFFDRSEDAEDLRAVIVAVDGHPTAFNLVQPRR